MDGCCKALCSCIPHSVDLTLLQSLPLAAKRNELDLIKSTEITFLCENSFEAATGS